MVLVVRLVDLVCGMAFWEAIWDGKRCGEKLVANRNMVRKQEKNVFPHHISQSWIISPVSFVLSQNLWVFQETLLFIWYQHISKCNGGHWKIHKICIKFWFTWKARSRPILTNDLVSLNNHVLSNHCPSNKFVDASKQKILDQNMSLDQYCMHVSIHPAF